MGFDNKLGLFFRWMVFRGVYALNNAYPPKIKGWVEVDIKKKTAQCYSLINGRVKKI